MVASRLPVTLQGQHGNQQPQTALRKAVAQLQVGGIGAADIDLAHHHGLLKERGHAANMAVLVDDGGDAGVGGPYQRGARFYGPEGGHGKMLPRRGRTAEPGVVGDVDQHAAAVVDLAAGQVGKDGFIADQYAQGDIVGHQRPDLLARHKVADAMHQLVDKRQQTRQRDILAERYQMYLVATTDFVAIRSQQEGTIQVGRAAVTQFDCRTAEQKVHFQLSRQVADSLRGLTVLLEVKRRRAFGPDNQVKGLARRCLARQVTVDVEGVLAEDRRPFDRLVDIALDQGHPQRLAVWLGRIQA